MNQLTGLILAGGASRRMGGPEKALMRLGGRPLIAHVIAKLAPQTARIVINANGDPSRFAAFGLPVVADAGSHRQGPLAGILAGLDDAAAEVPGAEHVLVVSCDAPFFPSDLAVRLDAAIGGNPVRLAVATSLGRMHPVFGLWPLRLRSALRNALAAGDLKATEFAARHGAVEVDFPPISIGVADADPFMNLNTPEDLATAETLLTALNPRPE